MFKIWPPGGATNISSHVGQQEVLQMSLAPREASTSESLTNAACGDQGKPVNGHIIYIWGEMCF